MIKKLMKYCILITCFVLSIGMITTKKIDILAEDNNSDISVPVGSADGTKTDIKVGDIIDGVEVASIKNGLPYSKDDILISVNHFFDESFISTSELSTVNPIYFYVSSSSSSPRFYYMKIDSSSILSITYMLARVNNSVALVSVYLGSSSLSRARYYYYYSSVQKDIVNFGSTDYDIIRNQKNIFVDGKEYYYSYSFSSMPCGLNSYPYLYVNPNMKIMNSEKAKDVESLVDYYISVGSDYMTASAFRSSFGDTMGAPSGWFINSPNAVDYAKFKSQNNLNESDFVTVINHNGGSVGGDSIVPTPTPDIPSPTPTPNPPSGGGGSGGGSSSSGSDYSSILSNILAKLDSINQSIQSGDFKAVLNNFNTIIIQLTDIKNISNAISEGIGQLQTQLDLLIDNLSNIHCNFDDKNIVQTIKDNTDRVVNKLDELLKKDVKVDFNQTVNQDGTNFWDFLTSLIDGLTETLKNLLDFGSSILEKLFDILDKLVTWLCDKLYGLIVPTGDYKEKMESQIEKLKTDSGFVWQSFELLSTLKDTLEGANAQTVGVADSNSKFTFTWSDVQLMGQTIIPSGSAHPQEYIDSLGFHDAQEVCNQICDALLLYGAILFVISQLKEYFE